MDDDDDFELLRRRDEEHLIRLLDRNSVGNSPLGLPSLDVALQVFEVAHDYPEFLWIVSRNIGPGTRYLSPEQVLRVMHELILRRVHNQ